RFQYVEIDRHGVAVDPGTEPYIGYEPISDEDRVLLEERWADGAFGPAAEVAARDWAIEHLASPHFDEVSLLTHTRIAKVREAVRERLESEIRYWDRRAHELKEQELSGKKPRLNSGRARARADE